MVNNRTRSPGPARLHAHRADDRGRHHRHPDRHRLPALRQHPGAGARGQGPGGRPHARVGSGGLLGAHRHAPGGLADLTASVSNAQGVWAGPFINPIPPQPAGSAAYNYATGANGTFTISSTGDSATVSVP